MSRKRKYALTDRRKLRHMHRQRSDEQIEREAHDFPKVNADEVFESWDNCTECHQAYEKRVLDEQGVCPLCKMTVIMATPNPAIP